MRLALSLLLLLTGCAHAPRSEARGTVQWFDASPDAGYHASFFLYEPQGLVRGAPVLVMPNNTGTVDDQLGVHRGAALKQAFSWRAYAEQLGVALLVPAFPRPAGMPELYTHALDADTLRAQAPELARLDLQLLRMIDAAHRHLGAPAGSKVLVFGFSAAGMFTDRFTTLHPQRVLAAVVGSPGGWPIAKVPSWRGETLRYPLGVADLSTLVGRPLDLAALQRVPLLYFLGAEDRNDSLPYRDGYDEAEQTLANRLFGADPVARWPVAEALAREAGLRATFRLHPGVGHDVTDAMDAEAIAFFAAALQQASAREKN